MTMWRCSITIANNTISGNITELFDGAGIYLENDNQAFLVVIRDNLIVGNVAGLFTGWAIGGGVYLEGVADAIVRNNTIVQNSANTGAGIATFVRASLTNNIVAFSLDGEGIYSEHTGTIANYNCLWDNPFGPFGGVFDEHVLNIEANPSLVSLGMFDDAGTPGDFADDAYVLGDYHLVPQSPCIDQGDPFFAAFEDETDIDGQPRVVGGRVDIGADEYMPNVADCDGDGDADLLDFARLQTCFGSVDEQPACDKLDVEADGYIDLNDYAQLHTMFTGPTS